MPHPDSDEFHQMSLQSVEKEVLGVTSAGAPCARVQASAVHVTAAIGRIFTFIFASLAGTGRATARLRWVSIARTRNASRDRLNHPVRVALRAAWACTAR